MTVIYSYSIRCDADMRFHFHDCTQHISNASLQFKLDRHTITSFFASGSMMTRSN